MARRMETYRSVRRNYWRKLNRERNKETTPRISWRAYNTAIYNEVVRQMGRRR